jgi:hypothetical protein
MRGGLNRKNMMATTKEEFHEVTAELASGAIFAHATRLQRREQQHVDAPLQLRHFTERFAGRLAGRPHNQRQPL